MSSSYTKLTRNIFLFIVFLTIFSGCTLIKSAKVVTAGEQTRESLLNERVSKFSRALEWGSVPDALDNVTPGSRPRIFNVLKSTMKDSKIVDREVELVQFDDEAKEATVNVSVRFFSPPTYIIHRRSDREEWVFDRWQGGWMLKELVLNSDPVIDEVAGLPEPTL